MKNFSKWLNEGEFTPYGYAYDIGAGTSRAIHAYMANKNPLLCGGRDEKNNGTGSLIVNGTQKHGIQSKADLVIANGQITVTSVLDGVRGRNSVLVLDGTINITAGGDGVTSTRDDAEGKGWVVLAGGSVTVKTGEGAGAVQTSANSQGGMGGRGRWDDWGGWGSTGTQSTDSVSQKAVKAATDLTVLGGTYSFDSGLNNFRAKGMADEATMAETVVQAAKLNVTANVTVTFEAVEN